MSSARILVTGAGGLLGQALQRAGGHRELLALSRTELDIAESEAVAAALEQYRPAVVINAAAYTNVDGAETDVAAAMRANVLGAAVLAEQTARRQMVLVQVSTDHVFDGGASAPYREDDDTGPHSVYGCSKLLGEMWVRQRQPRHWIVRTAGLFGDGGRNFVDAVGQRLLRGEPVRVVCDQTCNRTYSHDLAAAILTLVSSRAEFGTYHVTNLGGGTWYTFAKWLAQRLNPTVGVEPVTTEAWGAPAWRPAFSVLDGQRWAAAGLPPLRPVEEAVEEHWRQVGVVPAT